jgi:hypothetical protein
VQDLLAHSGQRQQLLAAVWQAFLLLAEHSMKVVASHVCHTGDSTLAGVPPAAARHARGALRGMRREPDCRQTHQMPCAAMQTRCAHQAAFKSDYMALVTAAGAAASELLHTKQALSQVPSVL